jgi:chemotaxis signal transduction protein
MTAMERKFLIFEIHKIRYAFDLKHISEVADPPRSWPIPFAPACFTGAMHIHGAIIAAVDLAFILGQPHCHNPEKIIVLAQNIASLAFLVDKVIRIVPERDVMIHDSSESCFVSCVLLLPEGKATLLDIDAIVKVVEQMII